MMKRQKKWTTDLIGVLATEEEAYDYMGRSRAIFRNSQNYLQFYIKSLIDHYPSSLPREARLFTSYSNELERYGFQDDYTNPDIEERIRNLEEFLNDTLFIFQPTMKVLATHGEVYIAEEIRLVPKLETYKSEHTFIPVPIFSRDVHDLSIQDFEANLLNRKYLGQISNLSMEREDTPEIVLWKENDLQYHMYGLFTSHDYAHGGLLLASDHPVRKGTFQWLEHAYYLGRRDDTVLFIDSDTYADVKQAFEEMKPLEKHIHAEAYGEDEGQEPVQPSVDASEPVVRGVPEPEQTVIHEGSPSREDEFMELFLQEARDMGLVYRESDLYNFHTAVKSNALTILAGMSGTGKSKLVQAYAKALGLDSQQLVMIPVRPSWTDDSELLGYVDIKNMIYRPGESGLIDVLIQAQHQDNRKLYIICFDEMNLARVEHYFAQFLSVLEMEPGRRKVRLYSSNIEQQVYNSATYPPELPIGNNIIFIGTVNLDESTYHFSDKVLDRSNVITLDVMPFRRLQQIERKGPKAKQPMPFEEYHSFRRPEELSISLSDEEVDFLWEMHRQLQDCSRNLGIGPRVVRQIDYYLKNLPLNPYLSRREAFDLQIVQRVLTKLRGPESMLKSLVGKQVDEGLNGTLYRLLDSNTHISEFTESKKALIQKAKELRDNGFTI